MKDTGLSKPVCGVCSLHSDLKIDPSVQLVHVKHLLILVDGTLIENSLESPELETTDDVLFKPQCYN